MRKRLRFAGYDFESGPDGTVIYRGFVRFHGFAVGDRVEYKDVNLHRKGEVVKISDNYALVKWEGYSEPATEWIPNLKKV